MDNYHQRITSFFDGRNSYDSEGRGHPENTRRLINFVKVQSTQAVLDLSTGTGLVAIPVAKIVGLQGSVIGVDLSSGMLAQAEAKIKAEASII